MPLPEYVSQLRKAVGGDHLLWLPGVNAVVISPRGHVLLQRRTEDSLWSLVSGIVEPGEHPTVAVAREVFEETGVTVSVEKLTSITVSPVRRYQNGDVAQYLDMTFRCTCAPGSADARVNDEESIDVKWFAQDLLPELDRFVLSRVRHALSGVDEVMYADSAGLAVLKHS